jgi:uncharacterized protein YbaR (Trm112 family)
VIIDCPYCRARVVGTDERRLLHTPPDDLGVAVSLVRCPACRHPLVGYQEDLGVDDEGDPVWSSADRVWPVPTINLSWSIPEEIRQSLQEAHRCLMAGAGTASAVMTGRALEDMCVSWHDGT